AAAAACGRADPPAYACGDRGHAPGAPTARRGAYDRLDRYGPGCADGTAICVPVAASEEGGAQLGDGLVFTSGLNLPRRQVVLTVPQHRGDGIRRVRAGTRLRTTIRP